MIIIKPYIFKRFTDIIFGFSTKIKNRNEDFYNFNLSLNIGDNEEIVKKNRRDFFNELGLANENNAYQKQVHGSRIQIISEGGYCGESDAMITDKQAIGLAISTADCTGIFIYDFEQKVIAAVHSGWRGTSKKILEKTLEVLFKKFNCKPANMICYLSPSISQVNYEVGEEVIIHFDKKYFKQKGSNFLLDISSCNYDTLLNYEIKPFNIQKSKLCSFGYESLLHSYRRDGEKSGRALGVIAMRNSE
jgi:polyphenol oxidase